MTKHAIAAMAGIYLAACRTPAPKPPPPVRVIKIRVGCLPPVPRPIPAPIKLTAAGEDGCPESGFEFCASWEAAGALEVYLRRVETWMEQAEQACKDVPAAEESPR